jgi:hypothetical protein
MRLSLRAAALASVMAFGASAAALAQTEATAPAAAPAPAPADAVKSSPPSVDWTIEDLLADPGAKLVMEKDLPGIEDDPRLDMVKSLSLRKVAEYPDAQIDAAKLAAIQADLAALSKPAS